jgi:hypothetical protein
MKFNFGHLFGGYTAGSAKPKAETEDDEDKAETEDDENTSGTEDDKDKAEDDKDDEAEEDDEDKAEDDEEEKAAKLAADKTASIDKRIAAARKAGRLAERKRIGQILSNKVASGRMPAALTLAVNTGVSAKAAIEMLKSSPRAGRLDAVMPGRDPNIGAAPGADTREDDKRVASASANYRAMRGIKD